MDLATFRFIFHIFWRRKVKFPFENLEPHNCDRHKTFQHIEIGSTIYLFNAKEIFYAFEVECEKKKWIGKRKLREEKQIGM